MISEEDCEYAILSYDDFQKLKPKDITERRKESFNFLASLPIFATQQRKIKSYQMMMTEQNFTFKEPVYTQDQTTFAVFIVRSGEFSQVKKLKNGETITLSVSTVGCLIGDQDCLSRG
jgi:CRP-like cAMP-binding protein